MWISTKTWGIAIALSLGALAACGGQTQSTPVADQPTQAQADEAPTATPTTVPTATPQPLTPTPQPPITPTVAAGRIVYANDDGEILTVNSDGSSPVRISPDGGRFTWPFWSPDGSQIVFSGSSTVAGDSGALVLYAYRVADRQFNAIYTNQPGTGSIAAGLPHFPFWAPDGGRLAFFASELQGLTLLVTAREVGDGAGVVLRNAPLYAAWSSDSNSLLVHGGVDHYLVRFDGGFPFVNLGVQGAGYRAPAWAPTGDRFVFVSTEVTGTESLYMAHPDRDDWTLLDIVDREVAFAWSPDGRLLAVAESELTGGIPYNGIEFYSAGGVRQPMRLDDVVVAFFWSPDSTKLAYVTPTETGGGP
jgi:TolB protein